MIAIVSNKQKTANAMHNAGLCPGDMLDGSNVLFDGECDNKELIDNVCVECWLRHLGDE